MSDKLKNRIPSAQDEHWIPLSDLMTGLMMTFLLIALVYMVKVEGDKTIINEANAKIEERSKRVQDIAILYEQLKTELFNDLQKEFEKDLISWDAELLPDSTVRFKGPEVLFASGSADLRPRFQQILTDFFPRYIKILHSEKYQSSILEVRIEGHTSSYWQSLPAPLDAYFENMKLSQERTRSTLKFVMLLPTITDKRVWLYERTTANGLSSSKRILNDDGSENFARSQRVEFRVRTDSETRIEKILEAAQ